ncbi:AP-1 complex subunit beta-1, partial [Coemansia sp. RSA 2320]
NQLRAFFCKYDDPIYVKLAKLEVILSLTTEDNARVVLTELTEYATEIDIDFVRKAVRSIGRIAIKIELAADRCVRALLDLIQTKVNYVVQEAIVVIRDIFRKYPNRYESIIGTLCENLGSLDESEARAAMIWIIGQYADRIDNSDEVLGTFLESFLDDTAEVQLALLTAIVKLFIMRPTAGQDLVPKVLKWATEDVDSPDIRDRGFIYWRLLSTDPELARTIVLSDKPEITAEGERLDMPLLEELLLQIGTLSSIYRKPPSTFIPFAKKRVLGVSPALTRLTIAPPP